MALATLSIDLVAQLASFEKGLDRAGRLAEKQAARIEAQQKRLISGAKAVGAAFATAFVALGVGRFTQDLVASLAALDDLSEATGATVENLSALEDVARRNGGTLDDVAVVVRRLNAALKDASINKEIATAFDAIGISAEELRKLDPAEALRVLAVRFSEFADDGNKARIQLALFSRSVEVAAPLMTELAKEQRLVSTATTEQAAAAEDFSRNIDTMVRRLEVLSRNILADALPALNGFIDTLNRSIETTQKFGLQLLLLNFRRGPFQSQEEQLEEFRKKLVDVDGTLARISSGSESSTSIFGVDRLRPLLQQAEDLKRAIAVLESALGRSSRAGAGRGFVNPSGPLLGAPDIGTPTSVKAVKSEVEKYIEALEKAQLASLDLTEVEKARIAIISGELGELTREQEAQILALARGLDLTREPSDPAALSAQEAFRGSEIGAQNSAAAELRKLLEGTAIAQAEELNRQILLLQSSISTLGDEDTAKATLAIIGLEQQLAELGPTAEATKDKLSEFALQAQRNIQDALGDTLSDTLSGSFDNILDNWSKLITDMVAQALTVDLLNSLFGQSKSGGLSDLLGGLGGLFGGAKADGGPVSPGSTFLVGERGPELFRPNQSGTIVPNGSFGGSSTTINVAAGPSRSEVLAAIQSAVSSSEARTSAKLRGAGVF